MNSIRTALPGTGRILSAFQGGHAEAQRRVADGHSPSDELRKAAKQIDMTVTAEGLWVELLENESGTFFERGVAIPRANGKELLVALAHELGKLPNEISIEGHTDSKPYAGKGNYSNWELSADRANAARRLMQANGVGADQVSQVRGYADQRLRKPEAPEDASNRRISVIVQYVPKAEPDEAEDTKPPAKESKGE
jgi:chemotaxis protein MotB